MMGYIVFGLLLITIAVVSQFTRVKYFEEKIKKDKLNNWDKVEYMNIKVSNFGLFFLGVGCLILGFLK